MDIKLQKQLSDIGIKNISEIVYNPSYELLYNEKAITVTTYHRPKAKVQPTTPSMTEIISPLLQSTLIIVPYRISERG